MVRACIPVYVCVCVCVCEREREREREREIFCVLEMLPTFAANFNEVPWMIAHNFVNNNHKTVIDEDSFGCSADFLLCCLESTVDIFHFLVSMPSDVVF